MEISQQLSSKAGDAYKAPTHSGEHATLSRKLNWERCQEDALRMISRMEPYSNSEEEVGDESKLRGGYKARAAGFNLEHAVLSRNITIRDVMGRDTQMTTKFAKLFKRTPEGLQSRKGYGRPWRPIKKGIRTRQDRIDDISGGRERKACTCACSCPKNRSLKHRIFTEDLIKAYDAKSVHQGHYSCIVANTDRSPRCSTVAFQFFPDMHGEDLMGAIFGAEYRGKLYSPDNGMAVSASVKQDLENGLLVLVPNVPDNPSIKEIQEWKTSTIKEWKIRVTDPSAPEAKADHGPYENRWSWNERNGMRIEFKNEYRPDEKLIYYHYCVQMLRSSLKRRPSGVQTRDLWGVKENYLSRPMLQAFVEVMGNEYAFLRGGSREEDKGQGEEYDTLLQTVSDFNETEGQKQERDDVMLQCVINEIKWSRIWDSWIEASSDESELSDSVVEQLVSE
ncbi:hypothetical protein DL98DRAFT_613216 [Cadophora sp. DSE1049]|nr:hypothetical protein DL98DRAFT_613216 [Cadophora sp. DSE1049]